MNRLRVYKSLILIACFVIIKTSLYSQTREIDSLENLLQKAHPNEKLNLLVEITTKCNKIAPGKSIDYCKTALIKTDSLVDDSVRALLFNNLGLSYYNNGEYYLAVKNFNYSLNHYRKINNESEIAKIKFRLAGAYNLTGEYEKALKLIQESVGFYESINDSNNLILAYNIAGNTLIRVNNYKDALEYYNKVYELAQSLNNKLQIIVSLKNIGNTHLKMGNYKLSEEKFMEVLKLSNEYGDKEEIAGAYFSLGGIYWIKNDYQTAYEYYMQALGIYRSLDNIGLISLTLNNTGGLLSLMKKYDLAEQHLSEGLKLSKKIGAKYTTQGIYQAFFDMYYQKGDYQKALEYNILFNNLKDSLYNENIGKRIAELKEKFETEKKEKRIEVLKKEKEIEKLNSEKQKRYKLIIIGFSILLLILGILLFNRFKLKQKQKRNELEKSKLEIEKRLLRSQMNPHFIFNSLNSIQNYILNNNLKLAESYLLKFSKLMRYNLENSRESMIVLSDDVNSIRLNMELEKLRLKDKFDYNIEISPDIDVDGIYIPPMLIQPFIENAIKHGIANKEGSGNILVKYELDNELIKCTVADDGVGRLKTVKQTDENSEHKSLGVQLTRERLKILNDQNKSNISFNISDINDKDGNIAGTKVEILIPFEIDD